MFPSSGEGRPKSVKYLPVFANVRSSTFGGASLKMAWLELIYMEGFPRPRSGPF